MRLILLSGSAEKVAAAILNSRGVPVLESIAIQEKDVADFKTLVRLVRRDPPMPCVFGCKELDLQRYQFFLKTYLLSARRGPRILIDETESLKTVTWPSYLFLDLPRFLFEVCASMLVLARAIVSLAYHRSRIAPDHTRRA